MMALSNSATLLKMPRRIRFRVISAKNRSTMLSHDAEVEVEVKALVGLEPTFDRRRLMGRVVVDDQMQGELGGSLIVDLLEKTQELAMAMTRHAGPDHLAVEHVESREQGRRAVALVVVRHGAGAPLLQRQSRLGAVERLDLALLVDRQDDGMRRRSDVEPDHSA